MESKKLTIQDRVYVERVRQFFGSSVGNVGSAIIGAIFMALILNSANVIHIEIIIWLSFIVFFAAVTVYIEKRFDKEALTIKNAAKRFYIRSFPSSLISLTYGLTPLLFGSYLGVQEEMFIFIILSAMISVAIVGYTTMPYYYTLLNGVTMTPITIYFLLHSDTIHYLLALTSIIWQYLVISKGWKVSKLTIESIMRNEQLHDEIEHHKKTKDTSKKLISEMMNGFALHEMIFNEKGEAFDYRFLEVNPAWEKIVGIKSEKVIGKTIREIFPGVKDIWIDIYARILKTGIPEEFEQYSPEIQKYFHCYTYPTESGNFAVFFNDITQRKKDELLLIESEERLHLIIENSPIGICTVDLLGNFITTNSSYEKMLGYSKEELKAFSFYDITHPDYRPENKELFQKMFSLKSSGFDIEKVYIRKDGKEINVIVHATGVNDEKGNRKFGIALVEDITEKKRNIKLLKQKKNELETIIKEAPYPILIHNEDGKILMLNQAWIDASGYSSEEIPTIDAWVNNIYDDLESRLFTKKHIDSMYKITKKVDEGEFTFLNKSKEYVTWQFSSAPLGMIDGKRAVIASAMDITELKKKDEMLISQSRHAAMGEMIGMIAHQWRQPLSVISMDANNMLIDIALDNFDSDASEEYAQSIINHTQHLSKTIDDFRNFFKPDKKIVKVNIRDTIDQTLSIVKDSLSNNNIEFKSTFETDKEVAAYPRELMQVLVNIITNAKEALIQNKIKNAMINIRVYEDEEYLNTEICDNGGGIDADILPKVFDAYFSTKDEKNGTGLGLYMSKMIIEEHLNGGITASNSEDGACFTVRLLKKTRLAP